MRPLADADLLAAWESAQGIAEPQRALALLAAADTGIPVDTLAGLPLGERDTRLFDLRQATFGSQVVAVTDCPACGERLELDFLLDDLRATHRPTPDELSLTRDGCEVRFRLPNSRDLMGTANLSDRESARRVLLQSCVLEARTEDGTDVSQTLPEPLAAAVSEAMAEADPQADVQLALDCPCGHAWQAPFDILAFLWTEIQTRAMRTFEEIHTLARAYGWSENEILALSPHRRRLYLRMVLDSGASPL